MIRGNLEMKSSLYKKGFVLGVIVLFIGASVVSSISLNTRNTDNIKNNHNKPLVYEVKNKIKQQSRTQLANHREISPKDTLSKGETVVFSGENDQSHPAFAITDPNLIFAAYYDKDKDYILWTGSDNDPPSFDTVNFSDYPGDKPSIKHWGDSTFYGTHVTDPEDEYFGAINFIKCSDPTDKKKINLYFVDWDATVGLHDMIDAEIACDNSQEDWEFGFISFVANNETDYGVVYEDIPFIFYATDPGPPIGYTLGWYDGLEGCAHTDADIDHVTYRTYAVYDWYDSAKWQLLLRGDNFSNWDEEDNDYMFEIEGDGNLKYPAVACYANNLVILAETDENTNKDIICYYSSNGAFDLETSFVVNTGDDERFPDIRHVEGNIFVCTFVKEGNLYACTTDNGGASWSSPQQINDNDGSVVEKYRTSDLCEKAVKVMWEDNRGADNDIYMGDIENYPPSGSVAFTNQV